MAATHLKKPASKEALDTAPESVCDQRSKTGPNDETNSASKVDADILGRIAKCHAVANAEGTPETVAKAAIHFMSKLMSRHNVTPKEVFATLKPSEQKQYGGRSIVVIERNDGSKKKVSAPGFLNDLSAAMDVFLDCKSYSSTEAGPFGFTFYGIAENTVAAALAFEMAYNLILDWGAQRDGAKNIYYLGVAKGLLDMAYDEKNREQERAKQAEEAELAEREKATELQRQGEIHRLHWHTGSDSSGGDEADVRNHLRSNDMLTVYVDDHCGTDNDRDPKVKEEEDDDTKIALEPDIKEEEEDDDAKNDLTPGRDEEDEEDLRAYFEPDFKEEDDKKINWQGDIEDEIKKLANKSSK
ncbi:hypothetical protein MMC25_000093 [Agyrium rufum]|nr:hypothetical protein [Agyrium rufum]